MRLKFLHETPNLKNLIATLRIVAIERSELTFFLICYALRDLVPFVQFKKYEKHQRMSVAFSKVAAKIDTPLWVFFTFFKLYKWYQFAQRITYYISMT